MSGHSACPRPVPLRCRRRAAALTLWLLAAGAAAHDTWFEPRGQQALGETYVALGTGQAFPDFDSPIGPGHLQRRGCRMGGETVAFTPVAQGSRSLILKAPALRGAAASCWAQLVASEVELRPDLVPIYFAEAQPPAAVREAWSAMQARGVTWKERYTKHARIAFNGGSGGGPGNETPDAPGIGDVRPHDMGMDMVLVGQAGATRDIRAADVVTVQVLRDGRPLPAFAVELRHLAAGATVSTGAWHRTDDHGRVRLPVPQAGRWLLRGIDIRRSDTEPDSWNTRFATLAFDVAAGR